MSTEIMLEFRAGKMSLQGTQVVPDSRKGLVGISRGEEGVVHLQWLDRTQNAVEDDQIIFPGEAEFEKEPKSEDDAQLCSSVNYYINRPIEEFLGEEDADPSTLQHMEDVAELDISSRAGNLIVPNLGTEVISDVTSSSGPVKLEDLQRILSNIGPADMAADPDEGLGLGDILKPELIMPLLETIPQDKLAAYLPEPESIWTAEEILELLQSPPFRQQVDSFTYVLRTGQIDLSQFGIDPSKYKLTVLSFLEALEDSVSKVSESETVGVQDPMDETR